MATRTQWGFWTVHYNSFDTPDGWTQRTVNDESLRAAMSGIADYANENGMRVASTSILEERADRIGEAQKYAVENRTFELSSGAKGSVVSYVTGVRIAVFFEKTLSDSGGE